MIRIKYQKLTKPGFLLIKAFLFLFPLSSGVWLFVWLNHWDVAFFPQKSYNTVVLRSSISSWHPPKRPKTLLPPSGSKTPWLVSHHRKWKDFNPLFSGLGSLETLVPNPTWSIVIIYCSLQLRVTVWYDSTHQSSL